MVELFAPRKRIVDPSFLLRKRPCAVKSKGSWIKQKRVEMWQTWSFRVGATLHVPSTLFRCRQSITHSRKRSSLWVEKCGNLSIFRHFRSKNFLEKNLAYVIIFNENQSNFLGGRHVRTKCLEILGSLFISTRTLGVWCQQNFGWRGIWVFVF